MLRNSYILIACRFCRHIDNLIHTTMEVFYQICTFWRLLLENKIVFLKGLAKQAKVNATYCMNSKNLFYAQNITILK